MPGINTRTGDGSRFRTTKTLRTMIEKQAQWTENDLRRLQLLE